MLETIIIVILAIIVALLIKVNNDLNDKIEINERSISALRENMRDNKVLAQKALRQIRDLKQEEKPKQDFPVNMYKE